MKSILVAISVILVSGCNSTESMLAVVNEACVPGAKLNITIYSTTWKDGYKISCESIVTETKVKK